MDILVISSDDTIRELLLTVTWPKEHVIRHQRFPGVPHETSSQLVLADVSDFGGKHFEWLAKLKVASAETRVVLLTPLTDHAFWIDALDRGAWDIIEKPVNRHDLQWVVASAGASRR
jgi:FixJ family two-component response regulator